MLKKKSKFAVCCSAFLVCCLVFSSLSLTSVLFDVSFVALPAVPAVLAYPDVSANITAALAYLNASQAYDGSISGFGTSAWAVMAIAAAGENPDDGRWANSTGYSVVDYLIDNQDLLDMNKGTDIARFILAMEAAADAGANVDSTSLNGTNYVTELIGLAQEYDTDKWQIDETSLLNDDFWGIMALVSAGVSTDHWLIQNSTEFIKLKQSGTDGGWSWSTNAMWGSDVDDTAAAIMALIAAGEDADSTEIVDALEYLEEEQDETTGGFESWSELNSCSDSWVISALNGLGQCAFQWPLNGTDVVDHLLSLQNSTGAFNRTIDETTQIDRVWYTSYALVALTNSTYPVTSTVPDVTYICDYDEDDDIDNADEVLMNATIAAYDEDEENYDEAYDLDNDGDNDNVDLLLFRAAKDDWNS